MRVLCGYNVNEDSVAGIARLYSTKDWEEEGEEGDVASSS